ncbi:ABC transporter ATP-binding protein [Arenibacter sp. GZD-96]|uniref:ABC transporter ATP-binding protein n=1 Tax=Aurantibrevibacter litoralis TaxID=3106030 RepID=UPI002AFE929B|nr:ABC transporter ATP-binding protein [Arenibacter sp. GZD-96]
MCSGELMAIVGINGIGKSTLLRTLGNVQPKLSGSIHVDDTPIEHYSQAQLAQKISVVLTEPLASKNMTVWELVALGRQPYTNWIGNLSANDIHKINDALALVEIMPLKERPCYELSDGQLQRTLIARALAQDTSIMLLDEPTTHLDLYHKAHVLTLLKSIAHQTQKAILFTTHEIDLAIQLCDTMLLMEKDTMHFGQPCELIASKTFESIFPEDTIQFDATTGSFRIIK